MARFITELTAAAALDGTELVWVEQGGLARKATTQAIGDLGGGGGGTFASLTDTDITSPGDAALVLFDTGSGDWRDAVMSGDATINDTGVLTVEPDAIDYAKIQNVSATNRLLGRDTSGAGIIEEISPAAVRTMLNVEDGSTADQTAGEIEAIVDHDNLVGFVTNEHIAESALTILESQITDGSILARLGANEVVTGRWDFSDVVDIIQSGGGAQDYFHLRDSTDTTDLYFHYDGFAFELWTEAGGTGTRILTFGANVDFGGGIIVAGLVDGRDVDADGTKLDTIETNAKDDQTSIVGITGTRAQFDTAVTDGDIAYVGGAHHDGFSDFVAAEHIDWAASSAGTIHVSNYIENATHTGEVTGSGALTVGPTAISNRSLVTGATGDLVLVIDLTDGTLKKVNVSDFLGGGGDMLIATYDPTAVGGDAFDMDNMVEGATTKIFTGTERTKLTGIETAAKDDQTITLTGNVTGSGTGSFAATIANDAVTYAKMQNVVADERLLGNISGAGGIIAELTQAQVITFLGIEAGSTADQTSIVGITGTKAQFDTAVTDGNIAYVGEAHHDGFSDFVAAEHVNWAASGGEKLATNRSTNAVLALASGEVTQLANIGGTVITAADWTAVAALLGVNTGDQTSIVGITGTRAQFDTAVTDGNIAYVGGAHHDGFSDFVAQEHIRWDLTGGEVVHADRYTDTIYSHPNHSGHVTSVGDGVQTLVVSAITGQTALTTGLAGTDELLLSDAGVIKRMDVSVMNAYFNANLVFAAVTHSHTGAEISNLDTSDTTTGTFVDARIVESSVTQHEAALTILESQITNAGLLARLADNEVITGAWSVPSLINTQNAGYTLVLGDAGKTIRKSTSATSITHTIPADGDVAFPAGTMIGWHNDGTVDMTIAITTDTLKGTDGVTGSRTLTPNATAVIHKITSTFWKYAASDL